MDEIDQQLIRRINEVLRYTDDRDGKLQLNMNKQIPKDVQDTILDDYAGVPGFDYQRLSSLLIGTDLIDPRSDNQFEAHRTNKCPEDWDKLPRTKLLEAFHIHLCPAGQTAQMAFCVGLENEWTTIVACKRNLSDEDFASDFKDLNIPVATPEGPTLFTEIASSFLAECNLYLTKQIKSIARQDRPVNVLHYGEILQNRWRTTHQTYLNRFGLSAQHQDTIDFLPLSAPADVGDEYSARHFLIDYCFGVLGPLGLASLEEAQPEPKIKIDPRVDVPIDVTEDGSSPGLVDPPTGIEFWPPPSSSE